MAQITVTKCLTRFFNVGDGKRPSSEWLQELKALSLEEKQEMAKLICAQTGDTIA